MSKKTTSILFKVGTVVVLLAIAAVMFVVGRGHTVYFDNKKLEYNGTTYDTPYKVVVIDGEEQIGKLYDKERAMTTVIGQTLDITFKITQEKGSDETIVAYRFALPYNMDGIIINLPGLFAGLPEEAYESEFVQTIVEEDTDEEPVTDEFGITETMDESADMADMAG